MPDYELTGWRTKSLLEIVPSIQMLLARLGPVPAKGCIWGNISNWKLASIIAAHASPDIRFSSCYRKAATTLEWLEDPSLSLIGDAKLSSDNVSLSLTRQTWHVPEVDHDGLPESRSIISLEFQLPSATPRPEADKQISDLFQEFIDLHRSDDAPMEYHVTGHPAFRNPEAFQMSYLLWIPVRLGLTALRWFAHRQFTDQFDVNWEVLGPVEVVGNAMKRLKGVTQIHPRFVSYSGTPPPPRGAKFGVEPGSILYGINNLELANLDRLAAAIDKHATSRDLLYVKFQPLAWPCAAGRTPAVSENSLEISNSEDEWEVLVKLWEHPREGTVHKPEPPTLINHLLPIVRTIRETDAVHPETSFPSKPNP